MLRYPSFDPVVADRRQWTLPALLLERAQTHRGRVFLDCPEEQRTWTFDETALTARGVATGLIDAGGSAGDRVLIMAPNSSAFVFSWFGTAFAGMVEVPINTAYKGDFLRHQVATTQPQQAIVHADFAEHFASLHREGACSSINTYGVIGEDGDQESGMEQLAAVGATARPWQQLGIERSELAPSVAYRDLAAVMFTSGTTGLSKGVMVPHAQVHFFAEEMVSALRLTEQDVVLSVLPLFHGNAQFIGAYPALLVGARFVLRSHFSASKWIDWVREAGATTTNLLGVMMDFIWRQSRRPDDADNPLRCLWSLPTAFRILDGFKQRFDVEALVSAYGMTEVSMPMMIPYDATPPHGAAGLLLEDYFEARIVDQETDEEVPTGDVGEVIIRPKVPWISCLGYFGMPEATVQASRNLWFQTGDSMRRDEEGWYYFEDRLKDAIRRRGENISSYEVEQAFLSHPAVEECAVVGVPSEVEAGEDEMVVWLVTSEPLNAADVWRWAEEVLPTFMVPRYIRFVDALPKTESNKIQKTELRESGAEGAHDHGSVPSQPAPQGAVGT